MRPRPVNTAGTNHPVALTSEDVHPLAAALGRVAAFSFLAAARVARAAKLPADTPPSLALAVELWILLAALDVIEALPIPT